MLLFALGSAHWEKITLDHIEALSIALADQQYTVPVLLVLAALTPNSRWSNDHPPLTDLLAITVYAFRMCCLQ